MQKENTYRIALLVAISCVLQISESLIPHPIPGLRLGLANMPTLIALMDLGFRPALQISILRAVLSSLLMGTFMSPAFLLSFGAAVVSALAMGLFYWLSHFHRRYRLSIIGISIAGAFSHNFTQLYLAYILLIRHKGMFVFLPWLSLGAVVTGWITALISRNVCLRIIELKKENLVTMEAPRDCALPFKSHYLKGDSFLHRLPATTKIVGLILFSLSMLMLNNIWLYLAASIFLGGAVLTFPACFFGLCSRFKKSISLIAVAFFMPLIFNHSAMPEALKSGFIFSGRIVFLLLASYLVVMTTPLEKMSLGLAKVLFPLSIIGISRDKISRVFYLSSVNMPLFWEKARKVIQDTNLKELRNLRALIPGLSNLIAELYWAASQRMDFSANLFDTFRKQVDEKDVCLTAERRQLDLI